MKNETFDNLLNLALAAVLGGAVGFTACEGLKGNDPLIPMAVGASVPAAVLGLALYQARRDIAYIMQECDREIAAQQKEVLAAKDAAIALQNRITDMLSRVEGEAPAEDHTGELETLTARLMRLDLDIKRKAARIAELENELKIAQENVTDWEENGEQLIEQYRAQFKDDADERVQNERDRLTREFLAKNKAQASRITNKLPEAIRKRSDRLAKAATAETKERLKQLSGELAEAKQQIARYEAEYVNVMSETQEQHETLASEIEGRLMGQIEALQTALIDEQRKGLILADKLTEAARPMEFAGNCAGNKIRDAAQEWCSIRLHGLFRKASDGKETYYFKPVGPVLPEQVCLTLNAKHDQFRHLVDAKHFGRFSWDTERLLIALTLTYHTEVLTAATVERKWLPRSKFRGFAKDDVCFRLAGAKRAAKSPTARNILGAKMAMGEQFEIRRFDPSNGSVKDFWRVAPLWKRYEDCDRVCSSIEGEVSKRQNLKAEGKPVGHRIYFVLDEVDNTIDNVDSETGIRYSSAIFTLIKESEHLNLGVVFSGQSPNVSIFPGKNRADLKNLTNIVIGNMIPDALVNNNDTSNLSKLSADYTALTEYCEKQNEGVDDPAQLIRFALVEKPGASRKFIELPLLGEFGFDAQSPGAKFEFSTLNTTAMPSEVRCLDDVGMLLNRQKLSEKVSGGSAQNTGPNSAPLVPPQSAISAHGGQNSQAGNCHSARVSDEKRTAPTDTLPPENRPTCPICGSSQTRNRGKGSGRNEGKRKFTCQNPKHPKGSSKTFYLEG